MTLYLRYTIAMLASVTSLACGSGSPEATQPPPPSLRAFDCGLGTGAPPPAKLILHAGNGVPGRYMVVLRAGVPDVARAATDLSRAHGGEVFAVWNSIGAFGVSLPDSEAAPMSNEPNVCYVEQDAIASGT